MSKTYSSNTLGGNWFEDRAQPLKYHVYGDFGFREVTPSSKADFRKPSEHREFARVEGGGGVRAIGKGVRFGMVTMDTLAEARSAYGDGSTGEIRFGGGAKASSTLAGEDRTFETETRVRYTGESVRRQRSREAAAAAALSATGHRKEGSSAALSRVMGSAGGATTLERKAMRSANLPAAGGAGGERVERGMMTSGSIGEQWLPDAPAAENTAVQRTWVPGGDPGVAANHARASGTARTALQPTYMSLKGLDGTSTGVVRDTHHAPGARTAAWRAPGRHVTDITAGDKDRSLRPGFRVFADE